jgi:regulator of nonsense transcripts 1
VRITAAEEIALEVHAKKGAPVPAHETSGYAAELLWNATAYDRMQAGLKTFAESPDCMSVFLYHQLLGHGPETGALRFQRPAKLQAPNMPAPNHSQARSRCHCCSLLQLCGIVSLPAWKCLM